jgi:hypothetical protein
MGLFKIIGLVSGLPIRPTTGRERARRYQRQANNLLEEQLYAIQNLAQPQQVIQAPSDSRPRGTCPACMEMMLVGASTCPHCHTSGITWPGEVRESLATNNQNLSSKRCTCGGVVALKGGRHVYCTTCNRTLPAGEYPHLFTEPSDIPKTVATNQQSPSTKKHHCGGEVARMPGGHVYCKQCKSGLNPTEYPHLFRR